jgi:hypothetical protein
MAESHVISALTSKRAELAGLIDHHRKEINRISDEVKTLDATIKLFEPEYRISSIKSKRHQRKNSIFKHGEANKLILDILRDSGKPINTVNIALEAIKRKGLSLDDQSLRLFKNSIGSALARYKQSGLIVEHGKDKGVSVWGVA